MAELAEARERPYYDAEADRSAVGCAITSPGMLNRLSCMAQTYAYPV